MDPDHRYLYPAAAAAPSCDRSLLLGGYRNQTTNDPKCFIDRTVIVYVQQLFFSSGDSFLVESALPANKKSSATYLPSIQGRPVNGLH